METEGTILVVDDEPDILEMIEVGLGLDGYRVLTATGGREGLALLREQHVDLVISDIKMPGMDGFETIARVRALAPGLPVIVATGYLAPGTIEECLQIGGVEVIKKPFAFQQLADAVRTALSAG